MKKREEVRTIIEGFFNAKTREEEERISIKKEEKKEIVRSFRDKRVNKEGKRLLDCIKKMVNFEWRNQGR